MQETEGVLAAERARAQKLQETVTKLQDENDEFSRKVTELSASEKSLADKSREQVGPAATGSFPIIADYLQHRNANSSSSTAPLMIYVFKRSRRREECESWRSRLKVTIVQSGWKPHCRTLRTGPTSLNFSYRSSSR